MNALIDSHAHIQDEAYQNDLDRVLARARDAGVVDIIVATSTLDDSRDAIALAQAHDLHCLAGVHPHEAKTVSEATLADLEALVVKANATRQTVVAIGEIGFDFHYDLSPRRTQADVAWRQIELAHALRLPLVFHVRDASEAFLQLVARADRQGLFLSTDPAVVHCYSGSLETAERLMAYGFCFGFDGPITFKNARMPVSVVAELPLDRLMIETDSPYLTPTPHRGQRNEPAYVALIAKAMAAIKGVSLATVATQTTATARRVFRLPEGTTIV